jgi:hypothetical protein
MYVGEGHKYGVEWPDKGFNHIARDSQCIYFLRRVYLEALAGFAVGPVTSLGEQRAKSDSR